MPLSPFPNLYKKFSGNSWGGLLGDIAGSSQPGMFVNGFHDLQHLQDLSDGKTIDEMAIDKILISNLKELYKDGIRNIYCLIEGDGYRKTALIRDLWQKIVEF